MVKYLNVRLHKTLFKMCACRVRGVGGGIDVTTDIFDIVQGGNLFIPKTRESCIRDKKIANASPCPICRDEYLVVDYRLFMKIFIYIFYLRFRGIYISYL